MQNYSIKKIVAGFALLLLAAGCKRDEVQVYQVQKEQMPPQISSAAMTNAALPPGHPDIAGAAMPETTAPPITWKTPDGWTEVPLTEFRVASFKVQSDGKTADISAVPLPGMAGGDAANVNRWRGQVGLSPLLADELQKSAEAVDIAGQSASLYDVAGTNSANGDVTRIIGVIQHRDDTTWFYKMTGDADLVEAQKPAFLEFLKSIKFSGATAQPDMPDGGSSASLPPGHPALPGTSLGSQNFLVPNANTTISHEGQPNWQAPSDWKEIPPAEFLLAEFSITGANGGTADVNVASLGGTGGGLIPNVNRWRGQLGLAPLSEEDFSKSVASIDVAGGKASLVDISGTSPQTGQPARLVGVIVPQADRMWFYKLMGDPATVENQKDAFVKFVQSAKY